MIYRGSGFIVLVALLICSGCGGRDTSTPAKALIGHWRGESSEGFFRPDGTVIGIDDDNEPGIYANGTYTVKKQNLNYRTMEVDFSNAGVLQPLSMKVTFSEDFNEMKWVGDGPMGSFTTYFKYVDSKLSP